MADKLTIASTRDLVHLRRLPTGRTALLSLYKSFLDLLTKPDSSPLRAAFLPALLGHEPARAQLATLEREHDGDISDLLSRPPSLVLVQGNLTNDKVHQAWTDAKCRPTMLANVFVPFAVMTELENAVNDPDKKEELANINMFLLANLTYELAHWIFVTCHPYSAAALSSEVGSLRAVSMNGSVTSLQSSRSVLVPPRVNGHDVGVKAIQLMFGCLYELLTYAIGERQVVKRRLPIRRTPALTPPLVYALLGDTPAILDVSSEPPTQARWVVPWHKGDDLYSVISACTPISVPSWHGKCEVGADGASVVAEPGPDGRRPSAVSAMSSSGESTDLPASVAEFRVELDSTPEEKR